MPAPPAPTNLMVSLRRNLIGEGRETERLLKQKDPGGATLGVLFIGLTPDSA